MKCKRWLSGLVAAAMLSTMTAGLPAVSAAETLPQPDYLFTFEQVADQVVESSGSTIAAAFLEGSAQVSYDADVPTANGSSNVLRLSGGNNGSSNLRLPEGIFSHVNGTDGVTLTMWVKPSTSSTAYMKLFDANAVELGQTNSGNDGSWSDPDFALAVGGEVYDTTIYVGQPNQNAGVTCKINYSTHLTKGEWQMLTVTMTDSDYSVYLNGEEVSYQDAQQGTGSVSAAMAALFENNYIQSLTYSSLGQSYYTSDQDFMGSIDDFGVYTQALTAGQVKALYDSYQYPADTGEGAVASFDMANQSTLSHGATGFLYGTADINVPSISLVEGLSPSFLVQKAMDGQQHPSGDAVRTSSALEAAGVQAIQVYLQDYYLEWPYDAPTTADGSIDFDSYQKTVESILYKMICDPAAEGDEGAFLGSDGNWYILNEEEASRYNYVLFNEPDTIWFGGYQMEEFCAAWKQIYDAIHAIDPNAKCAGPNTTNYVKTWNQDFFQFCYENDCLPEIVTWHELYDGGNLANANDPNDAGMKGDSTITFYNHCLDMTALLSQYYPADEMPEIVVNEYALFDDIGSPGRLVKWLSMLEDQDISGCMAYWGLANTLNEMAADQFNPNSTWWLYHWYSQMTGTQRAYIFNNNPNATDEEKAEAFYNLEDTYYGLTSYDEENNIAYSLFGGSTLEENETIRLTNMDATALAGVNGAVNVKVYGVGYSGQMGITSQPQVIYDGPVQVVDNTLTVTVTGTDEMDAYYAVFTPTDRAGEASAVCSMSTLSYEAEDAALLGGAQVYTKTGTNDMATSGRAIVGNINNNGDGVQFTVDVPETGVYELDLFYSIQAPFVDAETLEPDGAGQNRAIGQTLPFGMQVDELDQQVLYLETTVKWDYKTHHDIDVYLTEGEHTITFTHINGDQGSLGNLQLVANVDKIDLDFVGVADTDQIAEGRNDFTVSLNEAVRKSTNASVSAQSLQTSTGNVTQFTAVAPQTGYYQVSVQFWDWIDAQPTLNLSLQGIDYAADADSYSTVSTYYTPVGSASPVSSGTVELGTVYLPQGASTMQLATTAGDAILGDVTFTYLGTEGVPSINASELTIYGTNPYLEEQEYAQSSDGLVLTQLGIGQDVSRSDLTDEENKQLAESNYAEVTIDASAAGVYSLGITYSNDEPAPVMLKADGTTYVHPYNVDLVERYMQVSVNGGEPETVYFRNTYSWDSYRTVEVLVTLEEGENTIRFYNDNSYQFSSLVNSTAPVISNLTIASLTGFGSVAAVPGQDTAQADTSRLESKLAQYAERQTYEVVYTSDSWAAVEQAAQTAQALLDSDATQAEINKAAADLNDALDLLTEVSVPVTEENLLAYYSFDGTLENSVDGSTGEVVGSRANGSGGEAAYTEGANGATGSAYQLTGSNGLKLDNPLTGEEYTVSFWLKDDNAPAYTGAVFFCDDNDRDNRWVSITPSGWLGHLGPMVWSFNGGTYYDNYNDTAQMQQGVWTHITVTANNGQATVYVNGNAICSGSIAQVASKVDNIFLGVNYWDTAIQGAMDELYLYNRAMSAQEVAALYQGNAPTTPEVNKSQLLDAMLQASRLDSSMTEDQQANLLAAMETASAVYQNPSATQQQVDDADQALREAIAAVQPIEGDLNDDGVLDVLDVMTLAQYVVGKPVDITPVDFTGDGEVDVLDVMTLAQMVNGSL